MRLAMSDELATDDDPTAEGYEVDTFAARGPDGPDSEDEDEADPEAKKTSQGGRAVGSSSGGVRDEVVFEIGDDDEADQSKDHAVAKASGRGERQGLMHDGSANNSEETLVPRSQRGVKQD